MRWGLLVLLLTGCAAPGSGVRSPDAPISSLAAFDPVRFQGRWHEVAGFHDGDCAIGALTATLQPNGDMHLIEGPCGTAAPRSVVARVAGPGRLAPVDGAAPLWLLWVDADYRTAVVGTPSGAFGYILDRGGEIPPDRLEAARGILEFNGYDLAGLRETRS